MLHSKISIFGMFYIGNDFIKSGLSNGKYVTVPWCTCVKLKCFLFFLKFHNNVLIKLSMRTFTDTCRSCTLQRFYKELSTKPWIQ